MPCAERFPYLLYGLICQADSAPAYAPEHDVVAFATSDAAGMDGEALAGSARHQHSCRTQVQSFSGNGHTCAAQCLMAVPVERASDPECLVATRLKTCISTSLSAHPSPPQGCVLPKMLSFETSRGCKTSRGKAVKMPCSTLTRLSHSVYAVRAASASLLGALTECYIVYPARACTCTRPA